MRKSTSFKKNVSYKSRQNWKITIYNPLVAQTVKHLPAMRETRVRSLGREDPLEKEMATHSSILAWKIPWMEPGRLQSMGLQRVRHDWVTSLSLYFHLSYQYFIIRKENINIPLLIATINFGQNIKSNVLRADSKKKFSLEENINNTVYVFCPYGFGSVKSG